MSAQQDADDSSTFPSVSVAVTELGTISAVGDGLPSLVACLASGSTGLAPAKQLPGGIGELPFAASVGAYRSALQSRPLPTSYQDTRQLRLAWHAMRQLEVQLSRALGQWGADRVGLVLGTSTGGVLSTENALLVLKLSGRLPADYSCERDHNMDSVVRHIALACGLRGPGYAVSCACSSGAKALASARRLIAIDACDAVIAGGVDSLCRMTLHGFHSLGLLTEKVCRPFDAHESGMNVSEGASLLLLERSSGQASPLAFLVGVGESSDAHHLSAPDPSGQSQAAAMQKCLFDSGLSAGQVGYINAHGTGTRANDQAEALALQIAAPSVPASSTKGIVGHQLGAAGATEAIVSIEVLRGASLPLGGAVNPHAFSAAPKPLRATMSNSFAFGGANVSLAFASEPCSPSTVSRARPTQTLGVEAWASMEGNLDFGVLGTSLLKGRMHGRASELTRLSAQLIGDLGLSSEELSRLPIIVGSALGQIQTTRRLLGLYFDGDASPLAFQSSVHNAVAGTLSMALRNREPSSSLAAGRDTAFYSLLEAASYLWTGQEHRGCLVVCVEEKPPSDLGLKERGSRGAAFVLRSSRRGCAARLALVDPRGSSVDAASLGASVDPLSIAAFLDNCAARERVGGQTRPAPLTLRASNSSLQMTLTPSALD